MFSTFWASVRYIRDGDMVSHVLREDTGVNPEGGRA